MGEDFTYFQLFQITPVCQSKCNTSLRISHLFKGELEYVKPRMASDPPPHTTEAE
jgi:hypothetical protein